MDSKVFIVANVAEDISSRPITSNTHILKSLKIDLGKNKYISNSYTNALLQSQHVKHFL